MDNKQVISAQRSGEQRIADASSRLATCISISGELFMIDLIQKVLPTLKLKGMRQPMSDMLQLVVIAHQIST
jgi:hypothetical protein